MSQRNARFSRGDLVEVKTPDEIASTLDSDGALDHLPFMPEMLEFCGRRFQGLQASIDDMFLGTRHNTRVQGR